MADVTYISRVRIEGSLCGGQQVSRGTRRERLGAHRAEHLVGGAQLLSRLEAATLAAQPLAVEEMGAGELRARTARPRRSIAAR